MNKYSDRRDKISLPFNFFPLLSPRSSILPISDLTIASSSNRNPLKDLAISHLSELENNRVEVRNNSIFQNARSLSSILPLEKVNSPNFYVILDKLDRVAKKKTSDEPVNEIKENQVSLCKSKAGRILYYKVISKGKKSPLRAEILNKKGKIEWVLSRSKEKPTEQEHDFLFAEDDFEIHSDQKIFLNEWFFIGVQVLEECEFSFFLRFGKKINRAFVLGKSNSSSGIQDFDPDDSGFRKKLNLRVEKLLKERKMKKLENSKTKNFIKINKDVSQPSNVQEGLKWKEKQENVKIKKNNLNSEKIRKVQEYIDRKKLKIVKVKKEEMNLRLIKESKKRQNIWIAVFVFFKTTQGLRKLIKKNRQDKIRYLRLSYSARKIQKKFRSYLNKLKALQISLLVSRDVLLFTQKSIFKCIKTQINSNLIDFIYQSSKHLRVPIWFDGFLGKIILIQRRIRAYLKINSERIAELLKYWNKVLSKIIKESNDSTINRLIRVSVDIRDNVIRRYLTECSSKHLKKQKMMQAISKKSLRNQKFQYVPDEETMRRMIKEVFVKASRRL